MAQDWIQADAKKVDVLEGGRPYLDTLELRICVTAMTFDGTTLPEAGTDEPTDTGYAVLPNPFPSVATLDGTVAKAVGISPTYTFAHDAGDVPLEAIFLTDPADGDATVAVCPMDPPQTITVAGQVFVPRLVWRYKDYD